MAGGDDTLQVARLGAFLEAHHANANQYRLWAPIAGLVIGAAAIPAGIVMLDRSSGYREGSVGGAVSLGLGIGAVLGGGLSLLVSASPFDRLRESFEERQKSGRKSAGQILAETESEWHEAAQRSKAQRKIGGGVTLGIGALALGGGAVLAAIKPPLGDLSVGEQHGFSAVFIGLGTASILSGLQAMIFPSSLELAYDAYQAGKPRPVPLAKERTWIPSVGYAPASGGGLVSFTGAF